MINKLQLMGHLGGDAQVTPLPSGTKLLKFSIPLYHSYKPEGKETEWINCDIFGKLAEAMEKKGLTKGTWVLVEGELHNPKFTGNDGKSRTQPSLKIDKIVILDSKKNGTQNQSNTYNQNSTNNNNNQSQRNYQNSNNQNQNQTQQPQQQNQGQNQNSNMEDIENFLGSLGGM